MREVIQVSIGQCGINLGTKFWEVLNEEHGVAMDGEYKGDNRDQQLEMINTFYNESSSNRYTPRAILVDLDPASI